MQNKKYHLKKEIVTETHLKQKNFQMSHKGFDDLIR